VVGHSLKPALKRGALIAAANWQIAFVQATADSLFKVLFAAPIVGGIFLVVLAVGADPQTLVFLDWRDLAATIVSSLLSRPLVLTAFLLAVAVVAVGGSLFVFLVKAGTVAVLVRSEREAGPIEEPPLHVDAVARASRFSVDFYIDAARSLYPRYARLGLMLMVVYVASGIAYLGFLVANRNNDGGWGVTALITAGFVAWITIVNFLYLLVQIVIAADESSVLSACRRVAAFLRHERRDVVAVFLLVLAIVVVATAASLAAAAALGLVAFVPFFGLAVLPLQLVAWLLRALVFQYLGLASIGAYLRIYRESSLSGRLSWRPEPRVEGTRPASIPS
jgi:heme/copper-type cytochrome/quinol oxidase subunit 4